MILAEVELLNMRILIYEEEHCCAVAFLLSHWDSVVLVEACHLLADVRTPGEHPGYFGLSPDFNTIQVQVQTVSSCLPDSSQS
jgi:hypothetical protein